MNLFLIKCRASWSQKNKEEVLEGIRVRQNSMENLSLQGWDCIPASALEKGTISHAVCETVRKMFRKWESDMTNTHEPPN